MNTTISAADAIALDANVTVRADYKGRSEAGPTCLGLVARNLSEWGLLSKLIDMKTEALDNGDDELTDVLSYMIGREPLIDDTGKGKIYYWPGLHVED